MTATKLRSDAFVQATATSTAIYASPCLTEEFLVVVRAGVLKLDIFSPDWGMLRRSRRVLSIPQTDRGITGYSQNYLQKNGKFLSTSTSPERNFAVFVLVAHVDLFE